MKHHKHRHVLSCVLQFLNRYCGAGTHVYLYKVKAHDGVIGNETADIIAKKSALEGGQAYGMQKKTPFMGHTCGTT